MTAAARILQDLVDQQDVEIKRLETENEQLRAALRAAMFLYPSAETPALISAWPIAEQCKPPF